MSTLIAAHGEGPDVMPIGNRIRPVPPAAIGTVLSTGRSSRIDDFDVISGPDVEIARRIGVRSAVASPIFVEGHLWGAVAIGSRRSRFASDTEQRMVEFCELIATAVASAQSRSELIASRARIVAAADDARRRIERDLHDGAQQRLVTLRLELRDVGSRLTGGFSEPREQLARIGDALDGVLKELREISRGIHPAILSQGGLVPALKALARRSAVPVNVDADIHARLPERVEVAAYYLVSEALTNAAKHADASVVEVRASARDGSLEVSIHDDGVGLGGRGLG
jgi:signal transduction histidine kinase